MIESAAPSSRADERNGGQPSIVIVANRGPNDFVWDGDQWVVRTATGGLVSMLEPLARESNVAWYCCVSEPPDARDERAELYTTAAEQTDPNLHVVPVPLPADTYHKYYGQVSNEVLWMLQHHLIGPGGYEYLDETRWNAWAHGYLVANRRMAAAVAAEQPQVDAILVQDYHLYPLPALLRHDYPNVPILHFTHIPFPDSNVMRLLPAEWRNAILCGLLGADVVGLQVPSDVRAFLSCCEDLLGRPVNWVNARVQADDGRWVQVRSYPASVHPEELDETMRSPAVQEARGRLANYRQWQTIVRVDRLDPSKNQLVGFLAFRQLLRTRPDLCGKVRFLAFLVPSRTDLKIYRAYRDEVYRTIDRINAEFAEACGGPPIEVFYTNDREQALAAMESCDVLLVNSREDGMNLVAKEWAIVSQRPGTLIVSETAGVVEEALDSALPVSPPDVQGTAFCMAVALDMPHEQRWERLARFQQRIRGWTASDWLTAQLRDLGVTLPGAPHR